MHPHPPPGQNPAVRFVRYALRQPAIVARRATEACGARWLMVVLALFSLVVAVYYAIASRDINVDVTGKTIRTQAVVNQCQIPSRNFSEPDLEIDRPSILDRFVEAETQYNETDADHRPFFVVYGAKGSGKTTAILKWLRQRSNVVSVQCERTWDYDRIWIQVGRVLGCDAADAERFVQQTHLFLHLHVNSQRDDALNAGKAFISIGRSFSKFSVIILDLSPRSVDISMLAAEGDRYMPIVVPEFNQSEAEEYLYAAYDSQKFPLKWLPEGLRGNRTLIAPVIANLTEKLVGTNPLTLRNYIRTNYSYDGLQERFARKRVSADLELADFTRAQRQVFVSLIEVSYTEGVMWAEDVQKIIEPHKFHKFPMLKALLHSSFTSTWRLYFRDIVEYRVYQQAITEGNFEKRYWISVQLSETTAEAIEISKLVKDGEVSSDISGLKEAVLKKLGLNQQGKFPQHLTVYPPGKKKDGKAVITKMSTPLQSSSEDEPYHVDVK